MPIPTGNAAARSLHLNPSESPDPSKPLGLADFSPRHVVWDTRKAAADDVATLYAVADDGRISKHAKNVRQCSKTLLLREKINQETGESRFKAESWKCRERHCPVCQSVRARRLQTGFVAALPALLEQVPNGAFLLLTLTVRNCPVTELRATLAEMGKAWQRLAQTKDFRIVKGWIRGSEVTRSVTGEAHPHFHAILLVPPGYFKKYYIRHSRWAEIWQSAARLDYAPSVDIRRVKTAQSGFEEAVKAATYSVKPSELATDPAWFHEFHRQVAGLRFLATGGIIKTALAKLAPESEQTGDIAEGQDPEGEGGRTLAFDWTPPARRYRLRHTEDGG